VTNPGHEPESVAEQAAKVSLPDATGRFAISAEPGGGSDVPTDIVAS